MSERHGIIRVIYLYLFALVGLFILVFNVVGGVGAVLDRFVFPQEYVEYDYARPYMSEPESKPEAVAELTEEEKRANFDKSQHNDFKRRMNSAVPGVIVGYVLWAFHWREIRKDRAA